jgi:hypothetical protein
MPKVERTTLVVLALMSVIVLAGCAPTKPQPLPSPTWSGSAPTGPLESDTWVVGARASLSAQAIAQNRNDFSLDVLTNTTGEELRTRLFASARESVRAGNESVVSPGPTPFAPSEVVVADDDASAVVRGCLADDWASSDGAVPSRLRAHGVEFRLQRSGDRTLMVENASVPGLDCSQAELPIALFSPAPEPSRVSDPADIVRPAPLADDE